jgi:hypothetical protein
MSIQRRELKEEKERRKKGKKFVLPGYYSFLVRVIINAFGCLVTFTSNEISVNLTDDEVTKEAVMDSLGARQA